jgi:hypothetical protein
MKRLSKLAAFFIVLIVTIMTMDSISFAQNVQYTDNRIPAMTSNTSPSGVARASSFWTLGGINSFPAWQAFDHNIACYAAWAPEKGSLTGWLEYDFAEAKCICKYTINSRNPLLDTLEFPKNWTFEAWDEKESQWIVLDSRSNIIDWTVAEKKEFTFSNTKLFKKYRINITANCGSEKYTVIGELEMMESLMPNIPINLTAITGNNTINLSWDKVSGATCYNIKRSTDSGKEVTIATTTTAAINYIDYTVTNGTKYYYEVSAINSNGESENSNEVSAMLLDPMITGNSAILEITMANGTTKEYSLTASEIKNFINWYDNRSNGIGKTYFAISKKSYGKPFIDRKEYILFDKIYSFEVKEYDE